MEGRPSNRRPANEVLGWMSAQSAGSSGLASGKPHVTCGCCLKRCALENCAGIEPWQPPCQFIFPPKVDRYTTFTLTSNFPQRSISLVNAFIEDSDVWEKANPEPALGFDGQRQSLIAINDALSEARTISESSLKGRAILSWLASWQPMTR
jgi:hypothetical protein